MTKLEKLYNSIQTLKELGATLPQELIEEADRIEEEIIKDEVIPALSKAISPIINQIERELILVVEYMPNEPLQVRMTRKRSFQSPPSEEKQATPVLEKEREKSYTIASHTKSKWTNLRVTFPDGTQITNKFAYQTFCEAIEKIGTNKVAALGIVQAGVDLLAKKEDDFYNQHPVEGGYFLITHSSTEQKKKHLEEISDLLGVGLKVEIKK